MPAFPCSIRDAADALGVNRNTLGVLVTTHKIATRPDPYNPTVKLLDADAYAILLSKAADFNPALVAAQ